VASALQFAVAMKKLTSFVLGLGILGTSSLALADRAHPPRDVQRGDRIAIRERAVVRGDRYGRVEREVYVPSTSWTALSSTQSLDRYVDRFDVNTRGLFGQVRLQNQTGRTYVRGIEIQFIDGSCQRVAVNQLLDGNHAMVNITLDGRRRIDRIVVDGRSEMGGGVQLYAM
jgi:hypothetical protein